MKQFDLYPKEDILRYHALFDHTSIGLIVSRLDGYFIDVNKPFCKITGYSKEELLKMSVQEITHPDDLAKDKNKLDALLQGRKYNLTTENRYIHKNKGIIWVKINFQIVPDGNNNPIFLIGIFEDNTKRMAVEEELTIKNKEYYLLNKEYHAIIEELTQDLEKLQKKNIQLEAAKREAEENDHFKTAFIQNMSHEIRTPMNAIMGFSNILPDYFNDKNRLCQFANIINQRAADLMEIINGILDIARIESGKLPVYLEECNLNSLFSEIEVFFNEYRVRLNKKDVYFNFNLQYDIILKSVILDCIKLKQILINLIGNAFKFTQKGKIEVSCSFDKDNYLLISVADTGIGIPIDKQTEIFKRFSQVDGGLTRCFEGTGLGLSIVKGLLDLLGGKIWLESEPGKGSTFYVLFPYQPS